MSASGSPSSLTEPDAPVTSTAPNSPQGRRRSPILGGGGVPRLAKKRPHSVICNGRVETWEKVMSEINCPICIGVLQEPFITRCGHTFCSGCIRQSLSVKPMCPQCGTAEHPDNLIPNFVANAFVSKQMPTKITKTESERTGLGLAEEIAPSELFRALNPENLSLNKIESLIILLERKREAMTVESRSHERALLVEFLNQLLKVKKAEKERLDKEVHLIEQDITQINSRPLALNEKEGGVEGSAGSAGDGNGNDDEGLSMSCSSSELEGFNTQVLSCDEMKDKSLAGRRKRMHSHFEELTDIYMDLRKAELHDMRACDATVPNDAGDTLDCEELDRFGETLSKISRYSGLKPLATLSYSADLLSSNNIVSSIEFDKDSEYFAIAGVTKKIKLFEYATVIGSSVDIHCPTAELQCAAKISCVAWSSYYKNRLASSDYDGCVSLWDAAMSTRTRVFNEHEKRVWSVDWSNGDPRLLASGSDDSKVKLWTTHNERSVATIEAKANVCCVKFCPQNSFVVAFGCADHCIHYYDFRNVRQPLAMLSGHKKAVSYVKFASKDELVSASTDSHLKLWNLESPSSECVRSFTGHINEKNFVGLATDGNYIACGSENNSLYIYYRHLSRPLLHFKFDNHRNMLDKPKSDDAGEFVSAVVWKKGSPIVVAANSQGSIKILELT